MSKVLWFDRYAGVANKIALLMILTLAAIFLLTIYKFSFDGPYAYDDFKIFVVSFSERFLAAETFIEKVKYFFSRNAYPHPKFFGRLFSAIHYQLFGTVNFKVLIMTGATVLAGFLFVVRRVTQFDYILLVPIALMLLLPERMHFWDAAGFPALILLPMIVLYLLSKGRIILPLILAFFTTFAQNPGMAIFVAAIPLFLVSPNKSWKKRCAWLFAFGFSFYVFWALIFTTHPRGLLNSSGFSLTELAQCIPSKLAYEGQFLSLPVLGDNSLSGMIKSSPVLGVSITIMVASFMVWTIWRQRQNFTPRKAMFLCFLLFYSSGGVLAALFSDNCGTMTENVAPRYVVLSVMAWVGIYLFLLENSSRKVQLILALVFTGLFLPRFVAEYKSAPDEFADRHYTWVQIGTMTNVTPNRTWFVLDDLERSIEDGVYKPSFTPGILSSFPRPEKTTDIKAVWYDFVENDYFCKVEAIIGAKDDPLVEIWIGESDDLKRLIPQETNPKIVRRFLRTGTRLLEENPPVSKHTKSYLYVTDKLEDCRRIRIRRGDGLSDYLKPT